LIEHGDAMKKDVQYIKWLHGSLIGICLFLLLGIDAVTAAELKDVRIGDYDDFTRVVFEFSGPVEPQNFADLAPYQLSVDFPDTQPRLIRKIPIDRSNRITNAQLWQKGNLLSAVLSFPFERFRFEYFTLSEPNRIAIDIFPLISKSSLQPQVQMKQDPGPSKGAFDNRASISINPTENQESSIESPPSRIENAAPIQVTPLETTPSIESSASMGAEKIPSPETSKTMPTLVVPQNGTNGESEAKSTSFASRLQYYLVVGLVIITIIILGFLMLMLLSRYRIKPEAAPLSTHEYLQRQDETIASLNARIQEQLKRYDEV
jgi:hypothetical protein